MRADDRDRVLAAELRQLGHQLTVAGPDAKLVDLVMARVSAEPAPPAHRPFARVAELGQRTWDGLRTRRRAVAAALAAVVIGLALTPPVRAAVIEWFGFGGVIVRQAPAPAPSTAPPPPAAESELSLERARELVAFEPVAPTALGSPDGVEVSRDRRVLSLTWTGNEGPVRLDQFDGRLSPVMAKLAYGAQTFVVAGTTYLWIEGPHEVVVVAPDGTDRTESARLAGRTLIWERAGTTLRLEADVPRDRAVAIARSARGIG